MLRNASIAFRITPALKDRLTALAKAEKRSLSQYVEILLQAHVDALDRREAEQAEEPTPKHKGRAKKAETEA